MARRALVARLRLRGLTQRQIVVTLAEREIVNPADGTPWSLSTINGDCKALEKEWTQAANESIDDWKTKLLMELEEVKRAGYERGQLAQVNRAIESQAKILKLVGPDTEVRADFKYVIEYSEGNDPLPLPPPARDYATPSIIQSGSNGAAVGENNNGSEPH